MDGVIDLVRPFIGVSGSFTITMYNHVDFGVTTATASGSVIPFNLAARQQTESRLGRKNWRRATAC